MIPRIIGRSYAIEADVHVPEGGAEGVLVAFADFIGGFALWVDEKGLLNHTYQFLGVETYKQTSTEPIPTGDVILKMLFEADEPKPGTGGKVTLWADDKQIGEGRLDKTISLIFTTYAGMDIGRDNGGVVDLAYEDKAPYAFTGTVKKVVFDLKPADHESSRRCTRTSRCRRSAPAPPAEPGARLTERVPGAGRGSGPLPAPRSARAARLPTTLRDVYGQDD